MTHFPVPQRGLRLVLLAAAVAAAPALAVAQGTAEQQEACAPDAVKLCSATIPDIPKTTACMKAHVADLSPRCRTAFFAATGGGAAAPAHAATRAAATATPERRRARVATRVERPERREPAAPAGVAPAAGTGTTYVAPDTDAYAVPPAPAPVGGAPTGAAALCRAGLIDAFTCRNTLPALGLAD